MSGYCRSPVERRGSPTGSVASTQSQSQLTPSRQLSDGERLKKVILELVDTEKTYVKVSHCARAKGAKGVRVPRAKGGDETSEKVSAKDEGEYQNEGVPG